MMVTWWQHLRDRSLLLYLFLGNLFTYSLECFVLEYDGNKDNNIKSNQIKMSRNVRLYRNVRKAVLHGEERERNSALADFEK